MRFVQFHSMPFSNVMSHILKIVWFHKMCTVYQMWMLNKLQHQFTLAEFMASSWNALETRTRQDEHENKRKRQRNNEKMPTNKYQLQHTILLCTCFACNFYQKANRVIAVNELYVLLSDQTVNVTHPHWERASEQTNERTNERTRKPVKEIRNTYPAYTQRKY